MQRFRKIRTIVIMLATVFVTVFFSLPVAAQTAPGVTWNTFGASASGDLLGTTVTLTPGSGGTSAFITDLTGSDFAAAPLTTTTKTASYNSNASLTVGFSQPVSNLLLYTVFWRGTQAGSDPVVYTFGQPFTVLSGLGSGTVSAGNTVLTVPGTGFHNGILQFTGPVTSLSITSNASSCCPNQAITFGLVPPPPPKKFVTICHIPPGNPGNAQTITVTLAALPAHLAHGDSTGPCHLSG